MQESGAHTKAAICEIRFSRQSIENPPGKKSISTERGGLLVRFILMRTQNVRKKNAASPKMDGARSSILKVVGARQQFDLNVRSHHFDFHPVGG